MLVITSGEPAGIGPDVILQIAAETALPGVVIGDADLFRQRANLLNLTIRFVEYQGQCSPADVGEIVIWHCPVTNQVIPGRADVANASHVLSQLDIAMAGCLAGSFAGMVTAPVAKSVICDAGFAFSGHTEYLAAATGVTQPLMLLTSPQLRVALVTTHIPLSMVAQQVTTAKVSNALAILVEALQQHWQIPQPYIRVAGLNPHAGEQGYLGNEDNDIIQPALTDWPNARVIGPLPADTMFCGPAADAYLAMYHDQGLPVIKYASFGQCANVTLGLPIVRTSVDHGTAFDLAASGRSNPSSFAYALEQAVIMTGMNR